MDDTDADRERRFRHLYQTHYRQVLAYARRRVDTAADAFDVAEDTFLVVWRRFEHVPVDEPLPWLYGVARLVLSNAKRSRERRHRLQSRLVNLPPEIVEFEEAISRDAEVQRVRAALARLRPEDQELLRLIEWEELTYRQVGEALRCSENAVALRFKRAKERLAAELATEIGRSGQKWPQEPPSSRPGGEEHR